MSKFLNQAASDALETLDKLAADDSTVGTKGIAALCKKAGIEDTDATYIEKFARSFEQVSGLTTEDLVKRALRRFVNGRDTDAIYRGISKSTDDDQVKCAAACRFIDQQDLRELPEDAALLATLEKKSGLGNAIVKYVPQAFRGAQRAVPEFIDVASRTITPAANKSGGWLGKMLGIGGIAGAGAAGGVAGTVGLDRGLKWFDRNYGPQAGRRQILDSLNMGDLSRGGNAQMIAQMMRQTGKYDPAMMDALERALMFRRNPWVPRYWS